jgi:hypothetical protein
LTKVAASISRFQQHSQGVLRGEANGNRLRTSVILSLDRSIEIKSKMAKLSPSAQNPMLFSVILPESGITRDDHNSLLTSDVRIDENIRCHAMNPNEIECFVHCPFLMYTTIVASFGGILFGFGNQL